MSKTHGRTPTETEVRAWPADLVEFVAEVGTRPGAALMLYGSFARGTATKSSDVDILELVKRAPHAYSIGRINVTQYLASHLATMFKSGSLFALHLAEEACILSDDGGELSCILGSYEPPSDYRKLRDSIVLVASVLDPQSTDIDRYYAGLIRLGVYLLRSAIYLDAAQQSTISFDLGNLAVKYPGVQLVSRVGSDFAVLG